MSDMSELAIALLRSDPTVAVVPHAFILYAWRSTRQSFSSLCAFLLAHQTVGVYACPQKIKFLIAPMQAHDM